jgi:hypothetical protein
MVLPAVDQLERRSHELRRVRRAGIDEALLSFCPTYRRRACRHFHNTNGFAVPGQRRMRGMRRSR